MPAVRRSSEKATTVIHRALSRFEASTGLTPLVILVPLHVFDQYFRERKLLDSVLPDMGLRDTGEWVDVRIVEHHGIKEIEVY